MDDLGQNSKLPWSNMFDRMKHITVQNRNIEGKEETYE
jgi:hypothetical protein